MHNHIRPLRSLAALMLGLLLATAFPAVHGFHFPWDQGHDTTDWNDPDNPGPCEGPNCDPCKNAKGSPVYVSTGHLIWTETDAALKGRPRLAISRTFNSNDPRDGLFGNGWTVGCDVALYKSTDGIQVKYVHRNADGKRYEHLELPDGTVQAPPGRFERVLPQPDGTAILERQDGSSQQFLASGHLAADIDRNGNSIDYGYDSNSRLSSISDTNGRALTLGYNATGRVSSVVDHAGRQWSYAYDSNGSLESVTDPANGIRRYQYAAYTPIGDDFTYQRLTRVTEQSGVVVLAVTYSAGRVATYTEGANTFSYTHTPTTRQATRRDLLGSLWRYTYDTDGLITQIVDPNGGTTSYGYDANGRNTHRTDPLGQNWDSTFDAEGRILTTSTPLGETVTFTYAPNSRYPLPVRVASPLGRVVQTSYDARGNPTSVIDPNGQTSTMQWNASGDLVAVTNALGETTLVDYNGIGLSVSETDPAGRVMRYAYDDLGRLISSSNAAGETTTYVYDALDRVVASTDALGRSIRYVYDEVGRLESVTDPAGQATLYDYDANGRLATRTSPDGRRHTYAYRADNLVSSLTQPDLTTITFSFDPAKRLTQEDADGLVTTYAYNLRGESTSLAQGGHTVARSYDAAGRLLSENQGGTLLSYARNADGERTSVTALGRTTSFVRGGRSEITQISGVGGDYLFEYDVAGRRIGLTRPNGGRTDYSYDTAGRLTQIAHGAPFEVTLDYTRDVEGRITRIAGDGDDRVYGYDAGGRLVSAQDGNTTFSYVLDPLSNDISRGQVIDVQNNRLTEDDGYLYTYDANGNLTEKRFKADQSRTNYNWNAKSQLVQVSRFDGAGLPLETTNYSYDAIGRRIGKVTGGATERYIYDGADLIGVTDALGQETLATTFGPAIDEPLGQESLEGIRYQFADHVGSVLATGNTTVSSRVRYAPFGETDLQGESQNPFRYTGREQDASDLYYYRARYFDPTVARFLSEDPIGLAGGLNQYGYGTNPTRYRDPSGKCPWCLVAWGIVEVGLAIYDAYDTGSTIADPCKTLGDKLLAGGLFALGAVAPGGGYSALDDAARHADDFFDGTRYTDKVLDQMRQGDFHAFPESVTGFADAGKVTQITGGDGVVRDLLQIPGSYRGRDGVFEFIKEADGSINHRIFRPNP